MMCPWFDKLTMRGVKTLGLILSLSKDSVMH